GPGIRRCSRRRVALASGGESFRLVLRAESGQREGTGTDAVHRQAASANFHVSVEAASTPTATMFASLIRNNAADRHEAFITASATMTWNELAGLTESLVAHLASLAGRRVGLVLGPSSTSLAALAALDHLACDAFLFDSRLRPDEARELAQDLRF